jgi:hypothetical protein
LQISIQLRPAVVFLHELAIWLFLKYSFNTQNKGVTMPGEQTQAEDVGKTGVLVGLGLLFCAVLNKADERVGLSAAVLGLGAFLYGAHEVGKDKRPVDNAINRANSIFGSKTGDKSTEVQNALSNIVVGGGAIFDQIAQGRAPK